MKIRKARKRDFKEMAKIYVEGFSEPPYSEGWTISKAIKKLKIFSKYCDIWVSVIDKEIVGLFVVNPSHWLIGESVFGEEMAIKKEFRGKGVATKLLKFVFEYYRGKGYKDYFAVVLEGSTSKEMHKSLGFEKCKKEFMWEKEL